MVFKHCKITLEEISKAWFAKFGNILFRNIFRNISHLSYSYFFPTEPVWKIDTGLGSTAGSTVLRFLPKIFHQNHVLSSHWEVSFNKLCNKRLYLNCKLKSIWFRRVKHRLGLSSAQCFAERGCGQARVERPCRMGAGTRDGKWK